MTINGYASAAEAYTKSLCACALAGAKLQGPLQELPAVPPMRALVIGLGAGSIPLWLEHTFPDQTMVPGAFCFFGETKKRVRNKLELCLLMFWGTV